MKQVKKLLCVVLVVCMIVVGIVVPKNVQAANSDFVIENGVLKEYKGTDENVVIPNGVTEIGYGVFRENDNIQSVEIPDTVKRIGMSAFSFCSNLSTVNISQGVTEIAAQAFDGCTNLSNITIPKTVTEIDYFAFSGTKWLEQKQDERKDHLVIINNSILYEGTKASGAITIPDGIMLVCPYAFYYNDNITSIVVPKSVNICDTRCFGGCTSLKTITFKNKDTKMNYDWGRVEMSSGVNGAFYPGDYWQDELAEVKSMVQTLTIKGYSGSTAETLAKSYTKVPWGNATVKFVNLKNQKVTTYGIPTTLSIKKGKTSTKCKPSYNYRIENSYNIPKVSYKSSNNKIAAISSGGKITAKKKGTATITITMTWDGGGISWKKVAKTKVNVK